MAITASQGTDVSSPQQSLARISLPTGAAGTVGTTGAMTSGTITVATTAVTANSVILLTVNTPAGAVQGVKYKAPTSGITAGVSFVITGVDNTGSVVTTDTSTVNWLVIN